MKSKAVFETDLRRLTSETRSKIKHSRKIHWAKLKQSGFRKGGVMAVSGTLLEHVELLELKRRAEQGPNP